MTSREIRQSFLDFFQSKGHVIVPSAPIVVKNDPTLMFTNAGMNQFKDLFLGNKPIVHHRLADAQKCLRVSGKHNDLEEVGVDTYHHTMFEMLGNWSFGDPADPNKGYFKKESIAWGWELLTEVYQLDKLRLYVTVFEGDEKEKLEFDAESYSEWKKHIGEERILKGNKSDNFWEMGDTGPCGPCSEIHYDMRSDAERKKTDGATLVNKSDPQVIEIWNHVFIQYNRKADNSLEALPAKHVDTGMGFERLTRAIQHKTSNYDTDIFTPLIQKTEEISGIKYHTDNKTDIAMRVISDHIRAVSFCIADGQLPSNTGAGYVVRRILRRAVRYGFSFLDLKKPFFNELVDVLADEFKNVFPELAAQREFVCKVIMDEETAFLRTLGNGMKRLSEVQLALAGKKEIPGAVAFELYDTYGFPLDLTKLIAQENNLTVDEKEFESEMRVQKERSRNATETEAQDWIIYNNIESKFVGYDQLESDAVIIKTRPVKNKDGTILQVVLDTTPFYAESGGQIGDTGILEINGKIIHVLDTKKENDLFIHFTDLLDDPDLKKSFSDNGSRKVKAKVDVKRRTDITYNHTATHLLHAALRNILGTHVQQKGSYVGPDRLRFDFSHFAKVTDEKLQKIENLINAKIRENIPVVTKILPIEEAKKIGAMMLFGEKYGDKVRVVIADEHFSKEFCGGTHVCATGQIGYCKIISEGAVAAGIRRIEAITGEAVGNYIAEQADTIQKIQELVKSNDALKGVAHLTEENQQLKKEVGHYEQMQLEIVKEKLKNSVRAINGVNYIAKIISVPGTDAMKKLLFDLRNEIEHAFIVLGAEINGKANLSIIIDDALVQKHHFDAGAIVRELGKEIDGGGGGQKFYATAGGKNTAGLKNAIEKSIAYLDQLN